MRAALLLLTATCAGPATSSPAPPLVASSEPVPTDSPKKPAPTTRAADPAAPTTPVPTATPASPPAPVPAASPALTAEPASPTSPVPATSLPPPADPPAPDLLGKPRKQIESLLGKPHTEQHGWTRYATVDLQYRQGRCVRLRRTAPQNLDCADVPAWAGIDKPVGFPLRRATTCEWPGVSERHKLADGLAATHDLATHQFEVWLRD